MKQLILLVALLTAWSLQAQKHDYTWVFGYENAGSVGDFNLAPVIFQPDSLAITLSVSNSSIADSSGVLIFYTNGCEVVNSNHEIMVNGNALNPGLIHNTYCEYGYIAGPQSVLILNKPDNSDLYYIFHKHIVTISEPVLDVISDLTFFSLIDMSLDNGQGVVIEKNQPVIEVPTTFGELTAVKHANGYNWWIITAGDQNNAYYILLLTSQGIQAPFIQNIGMPASLNGSGGGQAVFSPDGHRYARYSAADGVFLFDFDRQSGLLSNFRHIPIGDPVISGGVAISPNSRYLYVSSTLMVYQYDLWAADIAATKDTVAVYDGFLAPFATTFYNAQLAPDCKIYLNSQNTVRYLHVIHNPDEPGDACNFQQHGVILPFNHRRSLPNFPNYRLGPLEAGEPVAPPCQLLVDTHSPKPLPAQRKGVWVFPNPASSYIKVVLERASEAGLSLYDTTGRQVRRELLGPHTREHRIALGGLPAGVYVYRVEQKGGLVHSGKLVVLPE